MMNTELMNETITWLKGLAHTEIKYNHEEWVADTPDDLTHWCGTTCCIGGFAISQTCATPQDWVETPTGTPVMARNALGLSELQASWLFHGHFSRKMRTSEITPEESIRAIEYLLANPDQHEDLPEFYA